MKMFIYIDPIKHRQRGKERRADERERMKTETQLEQKSR